MRRTAMILGVAALAAAAGSPAMFAQQQGAAANPQGAAANLTLVYEREVFSYDAQNRRDPFRPLTADDELGPRFESLSLRGIIYSTGRGRSIALISDADGRVYRARVGDRVGNARVIEIGPVRVVMAVENFGATRQEILELPTRGGTDE